MKNHGFSIIEIVIVLAILSILSYVGYGTYKQSLIEANEESTKDQLTNAMLDFEKYYADNGSYSASDTTYPTTVSDRLAAFNNKYYTFKLLPTVIESNSQTVCIEAIPNSSTIQANSTILVIDNTGNLTPFVPSSCGFSVDVPHERCDDIAHSTGKFNSNYGNYPICDDAHYPPSQYPNGCPVGIYYSCSGHCEGSLVLRDCSGYCQNVTVYCSFGACSGYNANTCKLMNCGNDGC